MTFDEWLAQQDWVDCPYALVTFGRKVWEGARSEIEQRLAASRAREQAYRDEVVKLAGELATTQYELETERRLSFRNQVAELEQQILAKNGEITALKIQLLNRNVSSIEASANFAMTDMQQQLAERDKQIAMLREALESKLGVLR